MAITTEYLAGFFDGEGCVSIVRSIRGHGRKTFHLRVHMNSVDPVVLRVFAERFGGTIAPRQHKNEKWSPFYNWHVNTKKAGECLSALLPHLLVKRRDAEIGLAFQSLIRFYPDRRDGRRTPLSADEIASRESLRSQLIVHHGRATRAATQGA